MRAHDGTSSRRMWVVCTAARANRWREKDSQRWRATGGVKTLTEWSTCRTEEGEEERKGCYWSADRSVIIKSNGRTNEVSLSHQL